MTKLLEMSLIAGGMIALLALVRGPLSRRVPAGVMAWLWGLALARLLIPGRWAVLPTGSAAARTSDWLDALPLLETGTQGSTAAAAETASRAAAGLPWPVIIWAVGVGLCALGMIGLRLRWRARLAGAEPIAGRRGRAQVLVSGSIDAPMTCGVLRPRIYLPASMSPSALPYVLAHEETHVRRLHVGVKLLMNIALCAHWFNPLVWLMAPLLSRDLEIACDARTLRRMGGDRRADYARTIVRLATAGTPPRWASAFARHPIEERITHMMKPTKPRLSGALAMVLLLALSMAMFAGAEDVSLPETVIYERATYQKGANGYEAGDIFERLHGLVVTDEQMAALFKQRGATLLMPDDAAAPEGFTRVEGGTPLLYTPQSGESGMYSRVPPSFVPPERERDEVVQEDGWIVETWKVPASELTEHFNTALFRYKNEAGETITVQIWIDTRAQSSFGGRIGSLDNGLAIVEEIQLGKMAHITAVPEDAYEAYIADGQGIASEMYMIYSDTVDTNELMPLLRSAAPVL